MRVILGQFIPFHQMKFSQNEVVSLASLVFQVYGISPCPSLKHGEACQEVDLRKKEIQYI